jgi:hypothetical protein
VPIGYHWLKPGLFKKNCYKMKDPLDALIENNVKFTAPNYRLNPFFHKEGKVEGKKF